MFRFLVAWLLLACSCPYAQQPNRTAARLALPGGRILTAGGADDSIEIYDPVSQTRARMGTLLIPRADCAAVWLPDGTALFVGGVGADGEALASAEIFDPGTGISVLAGEMAEGRNTVSAAVIPGNHRVLISGGGRAPELYVPWRRKFVSGEIHNSTVQAARGSRSILLYGQGWIPGETLQMEAVGAATAPSRPKLALVDSFGRWQMTLPDDWPGQRLYLTVQGSQAEAMAVLPDAGSPVNTQTSVTPSQNPAAPGATVIFTGAVTALPPGTGTPTGAISILDNGTAKATGSLDASAHFSIAVAGLALGTHTMTASYAPTGVFESSTGTVTETLGTTLTQVTASPQNPVYGSTTTLTATVAYSPASSALPNGSVTFRADGAALTGGTKTLSGGMASLVLPATLLPGTHTITAAFAPSDSSIASTSNSLPLAVRQASTTPTANASLSTVSIGQPVSLSIGVPAAAGAPPPTGSVQVSDGTQVLGVATLSNGAGNLTISFTKGGAHTLGLNYSGDTLYAGGTGSLQITVSQIASTVILTASPAALTVGQSLSVQVQIGPAPPAGVSAPTGSVQLFDGTQALSVLTLSAGAASTTITTLTAGTHQLTASYVGDGSWLAGKSVGSTVVVTQTTTTLQLSASPSAPLLGQPVTLIATLLAATGAPFPSGSVQFSDGTRVLGSAVAISGRAALNATFIQAGSHTITAAYSGDVNYAAASASIQEAVSALSGSLALTITPSVATFGQTVTLNVQVSAPLAGSGIPAPTGIIQILEGSISLTSLVISSGSASTAISNFSPGTHSLSASYSGDSNWLPVNSTTAALIVGPAPTVTTLLASPVSATDTQQTLTASVTPTYTVPLAPTGTVQFLDQTTGAILTSAALTGSAATVTIPVTTDSIYAVYSGDPNFASSISRPLARIALVNSAAFTSASFAADEFVTIFGSNLGATTSGTAVSVTDSTGVAQQGSVIFVAPSQINMIMPAALAAGPGTVAVSTASGTVFTSAITLTAVAPGLFSADASGTGLAAAQIIRVHADLSQTVEAVTSPINIGTDTLYLVLYGTGIRHLVSSINCTIDGMVLPVAYAGAQGLYPGLDQVNVLLPAALQGSGVVNVVVTADGKASNTVTLTFQ